jgi:nitrogen regulatory protein P-II 1
VRKIEAIVSSGKVDTIREALLEAGIQKMTVTEVRDYRNYKSHIEIYRTNIYSLDSIARVKMETVVPQNKVSTVLSILKKNDNPGINEEDIKIIISSVNDVSIIHANGFGESV